jgi:hypothetical protein
VKNIISNLVLLALLLFGTGCRGAGGDIPFMPIAGPVATSPSLDKTDSVYAGAFSHENEKAAPGSTPFSTNRTAAGR